MSPLRVLRGLIFGAIGGLIGWVLLEFLPLPYPFQPTRYEPPNPAPPPMPIGQNALLGVVLGLTIGGMLGIAEGLSEGTTARFKRSVVAFLGLGAVGGYIGSYFGHLLYAVLGGNPLLIAGGADFFRQLIARSLSWTMMGLFMGVVFGVPNLSYRRMWNGALGGAIGGFLGGFIFQVLESAGLFMGPQLRMIGFPIIGAAIGFFINLIAEVMKRTWVKVLIGRNEGREHVLDTGLAYVGRDELADIPVFVDPQVPKRMASFRLTDGRYALYPETNALPIIVNGQPLTPGQVLRDGDAIQFGRVTLAYNEKATATGSSRPVDSIQLATYAPAPPTNPGAVPIPRGGNVCEFCGQTRDPSTGACACSVGGAPGGYAPAGYDPGYAQPGYADPGYGGGYGAPAGDPGYAATVMSPGAGGYEVQDTGTGPRLVVFDGPLTGQVIALTSMDAGIGREPTQDIPLVGDTTASRRHARIMYVNGAWILRDEGSANGTWVNGVRIQEQPLFPGDTLRIGQTQVRFEV